jgi:hypothetical protein
VRLEDLPDYIGVVTIRFCDCFRMSLLYCEWTGTTEGLVFLRPLRMPVEAASDRTTLHIVVELVLRLCAGSLLSCAQLNLLSIESGVARDQSTLLASGDSAVLRRQTLQGRVCRGDGCMLWKKQVVV